MPNPFIVEDAVPPDRFFDRKREVELFRMQLESGKRKFLIAIVAPLKFGKTSLMLKYLDVVKRYDDIIPVYIDLRENSRPIGTLAEELSSKLDPGLMESYKMARERGDPLVFFRAVNDVLVAKDKHLFIFFDEFHLLPEAVKAEGFLREFQDKRIFGFFRGYADRRRISYIVCGSVVEPLMDALDVWGGRFWMIYLGPFSKEDAVEMMEKLFSDAGMRVSRETIEEIAEAAGYHPFYMQFLGNYLFSKGSVGRRALIEAKEELASYLAVIFDEYIRRLNKMGTDFIRVLVKIAKGEKITFNEKLLAIDLLRKGFLRKRNARYEVIDPLFRRYLEAFDVTDEPPQVVIVGHWAERIVGNYLLRRGYMPYYSHDSRGAFDIYVRIRSVDVGIQVRYSSRGEAVLDAEECDRMRKAAGEMGWVPVLALVTDRIDFFPKPEPGKYKRGEGYPEIEEAVGSAPRHKRSSEGG